MARPTLARPLLGSLNNVVQAQRKSNALPTGGGAVLGYPSGD